MRRVAITGVGVVNSSGVGAANFCESIRGGKNTLSQVDQFVSSAMPTTVAGQISSFDPADYISPRFLVKIDTFTKYAWAASKMALDDSGLDLSGLDSYKVGVWLGNNAGGWDICERGLYELYREGQEFVNPWQATAWFLSSPQGYLTIAHGLRGSSKSFVCDRASSASALYFAYRSIRSGENNIILSGGTEAPITPFAMNCYYDIGEMATKSDDPTEYRPFAADSRGLLIGEGAAILVLEELESAKNRGAKIYGELLSAVSYTDTEKSSGIYFAKAMSESLKNASLNADDIDVIYTEGAGSEELDRIEHDAMMQVFSSVKKMPYISCPKSGFGHLYGASSATDIVCGLLGSEHHFIPPTPNTKTVAEWVDFPLCQETVETEVNCFMVNSRARDGSNFSLIIKTNIN